MEVRTIDGEPALSLGSCSVFRKAKWLSADETTSGQEATPRESYVHDRDSLTQQRRRGSNSRSR